MEVNNTNTNEFATVVVQEDNNTLYEKKKSNKKIPIIIIIVLLIIGGGVFLFLNKDKLFKKEDNKPEEKQQEIKNDIKLSEYRMTGNDLQDFDLLFLKHDNKKENRIYSPLSIKYALLMLAEGATGDTKTQITDIIGDYKPFKYTNNKNMSFANALFIRDSYKNNINKTYIDTLATKYNAEVVYDSFKNTSSLNSWVSEKTLGLIDDLFDNISDKDYILVNALGIDMDWKNVIQPYSEYFDVYYEHEGFSTFVSPVEIGGFGENEFKGLEDYAVGGTFQAATNKYDIIKELGEQNIKNTVQSEYMKWYADPDSDKCGDEKPKLSDAELNEWINDLKKNYKHIDSSTDFAFYTDDDIKVFAKELKEYNGIKLQYLAILPKKVDLDKYINDTNATKINDIIKKLKPIKLDSFKDGYITFIDGFVPFYKYEYDLELIKILNEVGIEDVFDIHKANLSNLTSDDATISEVKHKANIEFTNNGIKASAATEGGGGGAGDCGFYYDFEVPIEEIDLKFDSPYMYFIRDTKTGEIWFAGTVYSPEYEIKEIDCDDPENEELDYCFDDEEEE